MACIELDVGDLEPCEPLERILESAERLTAGDWLLVSHRREPHPLFPLLEKRGFEWRVEALGDTRFHIRVWRQGDADAATAASATGAK